MPRQKPRSGRYSHPPPTWEMSSPSTPEVREGELGKAESPDPFLAERPCLEEAPPLAGWWGPGPSKHPQPPLVGHLFLRDFRKKWGTENSHLVPQESKVAHKVVLEPPVARPAPHAA